MATKPIDAHVKELVAFKRQNGHLALSSSTLDLYRWASTQRELWRRGRMEPLLEKQLRAIGFPFEVAAVEWEVYYTFVLRLFKSHGLLPRPGSGPAQWLERQRELNRQGRLPADRVKRLARMHAL